MVWQEFVILHYLFQEFHFYFFGSPNSEFAWLRTTGFRSIRSSWRPVRLPLGTKRMHFLKHFPNCDFLIKFLTNIGIVTYCQSCSVDKPLHWSNPRNFEALQTVSWRHCLIISFANFSVSKFVSSFSLQELVLGPNSLTELAKMVRGFY